MKFSLQQKLREVLLLQPYGVNKSVYAFLNVDGHIGIDLTVGDGDPLVAYTDGEIASIRDKEGDVVLLTYPDQDGLCLEIIYSHCKDIMVKPGDKVVAGQILANQNSHGWSVVWPNEVERTAYSHLHLNTRIVRRISQPKGQTLIWNFASMSVIPYEIVESNARLDHFSNPNDYSVQVIEKFAEGIAAFEGFTDGKSGVAVRNNNPGNLRYSPVQTDQRDGFAYFPSVERGWEALKMDLRVKAKGNSKWLKANATILEFCKVWAPDWDGNNPMNYAKFLVEYCGLRGINDPLSDILLTEIEWLKKYNFAPYYPEDPKFSNVLKIFRYLWSVIFSEKFKNENK